ncbi:hypothetical protein D3C80_2001790 [compost metagenome]
MGDLLHLLGGEALGLQHHGDRIALERNLGEHVDLLERDVAHRDLSGGLDSGAHPRQPEFMGADTKNG